MNFNLKQCIPHIVAMLLFVVASLLYFSPVLQGKQIKQHDISQYIGMSKSFKDFNKTADEETYWADAGFGGMPTYQLGAKYPHNYIKKLDLLLRFLPRPADYVFLCLICFYVLLLVMKVDWRYALLGSFAFAFSTYFLVILGAGHNSKIHAIAYFPLVLAGIFLVFRKKYLLGFILTAIAMGLELNANHPQMTYYLLLLVLVIGLVYLIDAVKKKELKHFFTSIGIMTVAVIFSLGLNATNLMASLEYKKESTRSKSVLTINPDGSLKETTGGLSKEYITHWSYGISESLNLFVPGLYGGSNSESIKKDAVVVKKMQRMFKIPANEAQEFAGQLMYWGEQPMVSGPAYIGAVVIFLFVLGLFLVKGRLKKWVLFGGGLLLVLSWGKNFSVLTNFFIDYVPFYDNFRAVSSMQVIVELVIPILAIFGLHKFLNNYEQKEEKLKALKYTVGITAGLAIGFYLLKGTLFDFVGNRDGMLRESYGPDFLKLIKEQRESIFTTDVLRTLIFVLLSATVLWMYLKGKVKENVVLLVIGCLVIFDLVGVDKRYVNSDNFVSARSVNVPFQITEADKRIQEDKSHYRVLDFSTNPFNDARTSYFHKSFGGYHAAKPKRAEDIFDFYVSKNNIGVVNMLNVKYIIQDNKGRKVALNNPYANGNGWFIEELKTVATADEEIVLLDTLNLKKQAVVQFGQAALKSAYILDSLASINLKSYKPNHLVYETSNANEGLAVFSEMYYEKGWNAYIDGVLTPHFRTNYLLRGLEIPKGKHIIDFKFEPQVIKTGSNIALASSAGLLLLVLGGLFYEFKKRKVE
ncbi:MAG: YfhO family protein [Flavobacteriaceae bacterium]|nr:YfhO family protein [Flavobacteriaceae bacterium]